MYPEERQQAIAALVMSQGRASVAELAQTYDVTTETVRRDLAVARPGRACCAASTAAPSRSGRCTSSNPSVDERETTRADHKEAIAARRRRVLPASRRQRPVRRRHHHRAGRRAAARRTASCVVVTNSVPIAARLAAMPSVSLQLLGGRVRGLTQAAVGEQALRTLDTLRVDIAFIGTNGISVRHGLSTPDSDEAAVKRAMVALRQLRCGGGRLVQDRPRGIRQLRPDRPASTSWSPTPRSAPPTAPQLTEHGVEVVVRRRSRMIVTVTPNPSIDRTVTLPAQLVRGAVHRVHVGDHRAGRQGRQRRPRADPGRSRHRRRAARPPSTTRSWPPCGPAACRSTPCPIDGAVRTNLDDHRNRRHHNENQRAGRGARRRRALSALTGAVLERARIGDHWVVLSGSLPPGLPDSWYADVVAALRRTAARSPSTPPTRRWPRWPPASAAPPRT